MEDLSHYNPEGSVMRRAQMTMLEILNIFHEICTRHNIDYWLDWGTLLGARRHAGFIPWDDDLDVKILWKDRKRLISALEKELPDHLKLQTRKTDKKYYKFHPKIRDTKSRLYNRRSDVYEYNGIFFDIFYLESTSLECNFRQREEVVVIIFCISVSPKSVSIKRRFSYVPVI